MISGPTLESAKEQAFERVRQWAPGRIPSSGQVRRETESGVIGRAVARVGPGPGPLLL